MSETKSGVELIAEERQRQIDKEGWSAAHDDEHDLGEMVIAAWCYAEHAVNQTRGYERPRQSWWPWSARWWKPSEDPIRNLVKAGALVAAEVDRLLRAKAEGKGV